jgi:hypothetical protein
MNHIEATPTEDKLRAIGCLTTLYTLAILFGFVFAATNFALAAYTFHTRLWGWAGVFTFLVLIHVSTPFLPYAMKKVYGDARFTKQVRVNFGFAMLLICVTNIFLIYWFISPLWVL